MCEPGLFAAMFGHDSNYIHSMEKSVLAVIRPPSAAKSQQEHAHFFICPLTTECPLHGQRFPDVELPP